MNDVTDIGINDKNNAIEIYKKEEDSVIKLPPCLYTEIDISGSIFRFENNKVTLNIYIYLNKEEQK